MNYWDEIFDEVEDGRFVECKCGWREVAMIVVGKEPLCQECFVAYREDLGKRFSEELSKNDKR
jgi:hypothetical protein